MYSKVLEEEVKKIEAAFATLRDEVEADLADTDATIPDKLQITAVVVTKRHHTRFYPKSQNNDENCKAGTVVDSTVTHPCFFDFYLQSHVPVQGTARPTYYFVIRNDMTFTANQIQALTNNLCYTFVRCTLPVGYVSLTPLILLAPYTDFGTHLRRHLQLTTPTSSASALACTSSVWRSSASLGWACNRRNRPLWTARRDRSGKLRWIGIVLISNSGRLELRLRGRENSLDRVTMEKRRMGRGMRS